MLGTKSPQSQKEDSTFFNNSSFTISKRRLNIF